MLIKRVLKATRDFVKLVVMRENWEKLNRHNKTRAANVFPIECVSVGNHTYGTLNVHYYKQPEESLKIGHFCSIAGNVQFFLGGEHAYTHLTTFPFKNRVSQDEISEAISKGPVILEDDVWIGYGCIILSGVTIGQGAVIGAGSIVAKNVPPYAVYVGNRVVKYRFSEAVIKRLLNVDYSKLDMACAKKRLDLLYENISEDNIDNIISSIWEKS